MECMALHESSGGEFRMQPYYLISGQPGFVNPAEISVNSCEKCVGVNIIGLESDGFFERRHGFLLPPNEVQRNAICGWNPPWVLGT